MEGVRFRPDGARASRLYLSHVFEQPEHLCALTDAGHTRACSVCSAAHMLRHTSVSNVIGVRVPANYKHLLATKDFLLVPLPVPLRRTRTRSTYYSPDRRPCKWRISSAQSRDVGRFGCHHLAGAAG